MRTTARQKTKSGKRSAKIQPPEPTLRRLPWYLSYAKICAKENKLFISSTMIANEVGVPVSLVAKDLSFVDLKGRTRIGYRINELICILERYLGFTTDHTAVVVGVGRLGKALMLDTGLREFGLKIVAGFDPDEGKVGSKIGELPVYHLDKLGAYIKKHRIGIAVLTVPITQAQHMAEALSDMGIVAIWNFTPIRIQPKDGVVVQNTSLYAHMSLMFSRIQEQNAPLI